MPIQFNADEIYTMAEHIEKNGAKFYRTAAKNNPAESAFLLGLAAMEDEHETLFRKMHASFTESDDANLFDPDGEAALYLAALAGSIVIDGSKDPSTLLKGTETIHDIVRIAIGLEKDSIAFYTGMKEMVLSQNGKEEIDGIIKEEMKHITVLNKKISGK